MTDSPVSAGPPAGWYADSPSSTRLRWWNGSAWTGHYRATAEALPLAEPSAGDVAPPPMTRAERRAAENAVRPNDPPIAAPPPTRAELRARTQAQAVVEPKEPENDVPVEAPPALEVAPRPEPPAPLDQPAADVFPDQILDRSIRTKEDRPLPPVVYLPQPSGYVRVPQSTFVPVSSENGPAKSALALILISLLGGVAGYFLVGPSNPALAGLLNLLIVALLFAAFGLAVVGLVLAARRPTKKREPVFALTVSVLLLGGVIALFAMRLISLGAVYAGG